MCTCFGLLLHVMILFLLFLVLMMMLARLVTTYIKLELCTVDALVLEDSILHHLVVEDLQVIQVAIE
jgi:hypothetical protein